MGTYSFQSSFCELQKTNIPSEKPFLIKEQIKSAFKIH